MARFLEITNCTQCRHVKITHDHVKNDGGDSGLEFVTVYRWWCLLFEKQIVEYVDILVGKPGIPNWCTLPKKPD